MGGHCADSVCRPTEKLSRGPSGSPTVMHCPSLMSTDATRRPSTNMPLRLALSVATQRPPWQRSSRCARDASGLAMRTSACGSRPTTMSRSGENVRCDESDRTVRNGSRTIATGKTSVSSDGGAAVRRLGITAVGNSCVFGMRPKLRSFDQRFALVRTTRAIDDLRLYRILLTSEVRRFRSAATR